MATKTFKAQVAELDAAIIKLQEKRTELAAKAENEVDYNAVQSGVSITFQYGKGDKVRELTGLVLGRKNSEPGAKGGDFVKVAVGEGYDAEIVSINPNAVTKIHAAEAAAAE